MTDGQKPYMTVRETADYLRVSLPTVWRLLAQGKLRRYKSAGTRTVVKRSEVEALIREV